MRTIKDKELLKKLILKLGKNETECNIHFWRKIFGNPFNNILFGAFNIGGKGDDYALKTFFSIKLKSKSSKISEFIENKLIREKLDDLVENLGFAQNFKKTLVGLIDLNKKYNLDRRIDLDRFERY